MSRRHLVIGNWKMHPAIMVDAKKISRRTRAAAAALEKTDVVICPPAIFLQACRTRRKPDPIALGVQQVSLYEEGAHTGEIGARMAADAGAAYAILGHSERRMEGETDAQVAERTVRSLEAGLMPIVCVGEHIRDDGGAYLDLVKTELKGSLAGIPAARTKDLIIAYEPVWAVGAPESMAPEQVYEMSLFIKKVLADIFGQEQAARVRVLYGGAVNFRNAPDILTSGHVDGLLVGRESVNAPGFIELLKAVDRIT